VDIVNVKGSLLPLEFWCPDMSVMTMMKLCKKNDKFDFTKLSKD